MNLDQFIKQHNLDSTIIDFCVFAIEKGESHVEFLLNSLSKQECDKYLRLVVGENMGEGWSVRPNILKMIEKSKKGKSDFTELSQKLGLDKEISQISIEVGYFFSPKANRVEASEFFNNGDYDIDRTIKVIKKYYLERNKDINPPGVYTLLLSPTFAGLYENYKENNIKYDEY